MKRAERRHQMDRIKRKIRKNFKDWSILIDNPKNVGKLAQVHGVACSCEMCGNPRKYSKTKKTLQELKEDIKIRQDMKDV